MKTTIELPDDSPRMLVAVQQSLLTADRDFSRFPTLRVRNPLVEHRRAEPYEVEGSSEDEHGRLHQHLVFFNEQRVGDNPAEWFDARKPRDHTVVDNMRAADVKAFAGARLAAGCPPLQTVGSATGPMCSPA